MPRALRLRTARLPPTLREVVAVQRVAQERRCERGSGQGPAWHRGPGAQCGMQPCGRPYVCLQTQGLPARALLGPRGDGAGSALRCARRLRGARRVGAGSESSGARRSSGCSRVCDRWMRALTLDRERHDTLNVRATHARSINNINYKRARAHRALGRRRGPRAPIKKIRYIVRRLRLSYTASEVVPVHDHSLATERDALVTERRARSRPHST